VDRVTGGNVDPATGRFTSVRVLGLLFGEYRFTDWLGLNATVSVNSNLTDAQLRLSDATGTGGTMAQGLRWTKVEAFLGLRANL
jgi:hypothetical protein